MKHKRRFDDDDDDDGMWIGDLSLSLSPSCTFVSKRAIIEKPTTFELTFDLRGDRLEQEEAESTDEDEDRPKKKQKKDKKQKKKKTVDSYSENPDVIDDLSGDEVDASNIIPGGRSSRSTRPVFTKQMYAAANLDDESEDEE